MRTGLKEKWEASNSMGKEIELNSQVDSYAAPHLSLVLASWNPMGPVPTVPGPVMVRWPSYMPGRKAAASQS